AEDGIRDRNVTGVQTCALPIYHQLNTKRYIFSTDNPKSLSLIFPEKSIIMFVPESWLRSYVNPSIDTDTLCHKLTMAGLEVEEYATAAPQFKHVVVAEITSVEPHPDADRLRVCMVDAGRS